MKAELKLYVILTLDLSKADRGWAESLKTVKPSIWRKLELTESKAEEPGDIHRKYTGVLSPADFGELLEETGMTYECETMGSLTLEYGMLPAVAYSNCAYGDPDWLIQAFVSPVLSHEQEDFLDAAITELPDKKRKSAIKYVVQPFFARALEILKQGNDNMAKRFELLNDIDLGA